MSAVGMPSMEEEQLWSPTPHPVPSLSSIHLNFWSSGTYFLSFSVALSWRRQWQPTPVHLPGKSHGQRSLVGCSPWGHKESDTEWLHFHFSLSCIGEGKGIPLQCSCLENPRDGRAWWAAVYGVAQNWIRLKRLSSSSFVFEAILGMVLILTIPYHVAALPISALYLSFRVSISTPLLLWSHFRREICQ